MIKRILLTVLVLYLTILPMPAMAATSPPDSTPSMEDINVYRHLMETDDFLLIAKYNLPYATAPNASATQAYLFRLLDTDNVTSLLSNEAYAYSNNGYGYGVIAFYASAADAPTWGLNYNIQIIGKPTEFASASNVTWNYPVISGAYSRSSTQAGNQEALGDDILGIAQDLEDAWTAILLENSDVGLVLSSTGRLYFKNSIPGLQVMAPGIFPIQINDPDYTAENWTNAQATTYRTRLSGTWVGDVYENVATLFGMEFHFLASIPLVIASVLCMIVAGQQNNILSGLMCVVAIGIYGVLQGFTPFLILSVATIGIAAFVGYQWFLKSSS